MHVRILKSNVDQFLIHVRRVITLKCFNLKATYNHGIIAPKCRTKELNFSIKCTRIL